MLTQLSTLKNRLALLPGDTQHDDLLTNAIAATSAIFERETGRTFARTVDAMHECGGNDTEICVDCYPIESIAAFELKSDELAGWIEQPPPSYLIRRDCVISLRNPLGAAYEQARVVYTGGYVLPGATPGPGQTPLPPDLEHAAIEQVASWFLHRDKVGLVRNWPSGGTFQVFVELPLLPSVTAVLERYRRWSI